VTPLVRLPAASVHARRRPRAVLALWLWEAALGLALGTSVASVAGQAYGHHPDGDAPLFHAGGLELLDLLRHSVGAEGPLLTTLVLVGAAAHLAGLLPATLVLAELSFVTPTRKAPRLRDALGRAAGAVPAAFLLSMMTLVVQAGVLLAGFLLVTAAWTWTTAHLGEPQGDKTAIVVAALTLTAAGALGVLGDLARAVVVRERAPALDALGRALEVFGAHPLRIFGSAAWRGAAAWIPVAFALPLATRVGGRGGVALVALAVVHQAVILARAAVRASWMAKTVRVAGEA